MLSTSRILLFLAAVILCGLLVGVELGLILIVTALVCFNSYEPFGSDSADIDLHLEKQDDELEHGEYRSEETDSSLTQETFEQNKKRKTKKMSLWKPRSSTSSYVRIGASKSESPAKVSVTQGRPSARPPIRYMNSPGWKSTLTKDYSGYEDRENCSLWGNPYSPSPSSQRQNPDQSFQNHSGSAGPLLSSPFLPRVKRAIGVGEANLMQRRPDSPRQSSSWENSGKIFSPQAKALPYPSSSTTGLMPLVRLGRHEKPVLNENNTNMVHSPVTVKIAAPSPRRLHHTRLSLSREEPEEVTRKAPDKETVLSALREKSRKRGMAPQEESLTDVTDQQAKRRKQDDSTSSSSSMVSEPEFLAELPVNGYSNIPLHMVGMKRPATPTVDLDESSPADRMTKKPKQDIRNNPIISSLSSSRRGMAKEMKEFQRNPGEKRRPDEGSVIVEGEPDSKQSKTDLPLPPLAASTPGVENRPKPQLLESAVISQAAVETPSPAVSTVTRDKGRAPQSLKKKLLLDAEKSSKKVKKGIYSFLNSPRGKTAILDVTAMPDDYDRDREAEHQRAVDMLQDIRTEEKEKSEKGLKSSTDVTPEKSEAMPPSANTTSQHSTSTTQSKDGTLTSLLRKDMTGDKSNKPDAGFLSTLLTTPATVSTSTAPPATTFQVTTTAVTTSNVSSSITTTSTGSSQQFTFKPVFPMNPTPTSTSSSNQPVTVGGFVFNSAKSQTVTPQTSVQPSAAASLISTTATSLSSLAAAPSVTSNTGFSFKGQQHSALPAGNLVTLFGQNQVTSSASTTTATPSVQNPHATGVTTSGFSFGAPSAATTATEFSFGAAALIQSNPTSTPIVFGQNTTSATSAASAFGVFSTAAISAPAQTTSGFSVGVAQPKTAAPSTLTFGIGQSTPNTTSNQSSSGLGFSNTKPTASGINTQTGAFTFGTASSQTTQQSSTQSSLFTATQSIPKSTTGFNFGGSNPILATATQPSSTSAFSFNPTSTVAPSSFNQSVTSAFGQPNTTGPVFGVVNTTTVAPSAFGGQSTNSSTTSSSGFGNSGFSFSTNSAPSFGQSTTSASAFGSVLTTTSSAFSFSANTSTAASAFGSSGSLFSFGAGSTNNNSSSGTAFDSGQMSSLPLPNFGTPTTQASGFSAKPAPFGQTTGSAFGSFSDKQPSSVFGGSQQTNTVTPAFGQATVTSVFGTATAGGQGTFTFGQQAGQPPATPVKGFDFSTASQGSSGFNFGTSGNQVSGFSTPNNKIPAMNFGAATQAPSATPTFGGGGAGFGIPPAGGMFSVGSGLTTPRPRSRGRRKGNKR